MQIAQDLEGNGGPEPRFLINMDQLAHIIVMLNELRIRRGDNGQLTHDIDKLLDDLPDFMIW